MSDETNVTASGTIHGESVTGIPVLNPGDWFGKTVGLMLGHGFTPLYLIAEAEHPSAAIDVLADHETYADEIVISDSCLSNYDPDTMYYAGNGRPVDTDWLEFASIGDIRYHGTYSGHKIPEKGIKPENLSTWCMWMDGHAKHAGSGSR